MFKVIIKRTVPPEKEKALLELVTELRMGASGQDGYISGETLRSTTNPNEYIVISVWDSEAFWLAWLADEGFDVPPAAEYFSIYDHVEVAVIPPFTDLRPVQNVIEGDRLQFGIRRDSSGGQIGDHGAVTVVGLVALDQRMGDAVAERADTDLQHAAILDQRAAPQGDRVVLIVDVLIRRRKHVVGCRGVVN